MRAREDVDDERHVDEAGPGRHVGEVRDPELVRAVARNSRFTRSGGYAADLSAVVVTCERAAPDRATQAHRTHQPLDGAAGHAHALAAELPPHLLAPRRPRSSRPRRAGSRASALRPASHAPDACPDRAGGAVLVVGRRGDRQHRADRLDPVLLAVLLDEADHHFARRSSSACAKYADALRRISFARFSSRFSRSSSLSRSRSPSSARAARRCHARPAAPTSAASRPCSPSCPRSS